jgi:sugar phosphate isomerase/epimerase
MSIDTLQISVCTDDLRSEIKNALRQARSLGFGVVDIGASTGPISPTELSRTGQRHFARYLNDLGLRLGSLRGPAEIGSVAADSAGERRFETLRAIIRLAADLRVPVVSATLGGASNDERAAARMNEVLSTLAADADRFGVNLAVETNGVTTASLGSILRDLACPNLGACCDSGAMLMGGGDPHSIASDLAGRVQLVRVRDAVAGSREVAGREVAMGEGHLDVPAFLATLQEAGFGGDLVVSRADSATPAADLAKARSILESHLPKVGPSGLHY